MSDYMEILRPKVTNVTLTPNPVAVLGTLALTVTVIEETVRLEAERHYSGEFYSNEV